MKTAVQATLLKSMQPYMLLCLAGAADLASSLIGINAFGLVEGNPNFTPFLTEIVLILYVFCIRKITFFPKKAERICEATVVAVSFLPTLWNISLMACSSFA